MIISGFVQVNSISVNIFATLPFPRLSTTSTVTTSVAQDQIPNDKVDLLNHMCILILTRGDGTPFDATSIQEEDIIKICVQLGYTHPESVLRYLAAKSVMLFHSMDEMLVVAHGVITAMTSHEEAVKVRTSPPSAAHVRTYMVVMDGKP